MMADDREARIAQLEAELRRSQELEAGAQTELRSIREREGSLATQLSEALGQQSATAEVLHVIAASPTDLQAVLDTVARHAVAVCGADDAQIFRTVEGMVNLVAHHGPL